MSRAAPRHRCAHGNHEYRGGELTSYFAFTHVVGTEVFAIFMADALGYKGSVSEAEGISGQPRRPTEPGKGSLERNPG